MSTGVKKQLLRFPKEITLDAISAEVMMARRKFPEGKYNLAALMEEVGELAKAMLEGVDKDDIEREAIQVACMAIRIIEEGDRDFPSSVPKGG